MSTAFYKNIVDGVLEEQLPSKLTRNVKPDMSVKERLTETVFRRLGWNETLDFKMLRFSDNTDITLGFLESSEFLSKIIEALESVDVIYDSFQNLTGEDATTSSQIQFAGIFLEEFQNVIGIDIPKTMKQQIQVQEKGLNLPNDTNPNNIKDSFDLLDLYSVMKSNNTDDIATAKQEKEDEITRVLKKVYDIAILITSNIEVFRNDDNNINTFTLENNKLYVNQLNDSISDLINIFIYGYALDSSSGKEIYQQLIFVKDIISKAIDNYRKATVNEVSFPSKYDTFFTALAADRDSISNLLAQNNRALFGIETSLYDIKKNESEFNLSEIDYSVNETFFIEDDKFEQAFNEFYQHSRSNYKIAGHSSVNMNATSFIKSGISRADMIVQVDESVPTNHIVATPYIGVGEVMQGDDRVFIENSLVKVGPIQDQAWEDLRNVIAEDNDYTTKGENGHLGRFMTDASSLVEYGYVTQGTSTKNLKNESNWTGLDDITNMDEFLENNEAQENILFTDVSLIYKKLLLGNVIKKETDVNEVGAAIATAYKFGVDSLKKMEKNEVVIDGNNNDATEFFTQAKAAISNEIPDTDDTRVIGELGGSRQDQLAVLASVNTQPDSPNLYFPNTAPATLYPNNHVRETESGHLTEFDDTNGNERINERHRTGTGYEIGPDGSRKLVIIKDSYKAVLGDDNIMITGACNISVFGDVNIASSGDINMNASNDINMVAGGDYNLTVGGDKSEKVDGSSVSNIQGDKVETVSGFYALTAEGDLQIEGTSVGVIARVGIVEIASPDKVKLSGNSFEALFQASISLAASETLSMYSDSKINMASSKVDISSQENLNIGSSSRVIINSPSYTDVTAKDSLKAVTLGVVVPSAPSTNTDVGLKDSLSSQTSDSEFLENIGKLEVVNTSKTQAKTNNARDNADYYHKTLTT